MSPIPHATRALVAAFVLATACSAFAADGDEWTVSKSSGEVWLASSGVQPASLKQEDVLKAGDSVRTGKTGRVLLKRGDETIMVSPNSVVGIPAQKTEGLSTTIVQKAGSILLDVEKRNVKHFEVETPYLAAVVKGTQFRVRRQCREDHRRRRSGSGGGRRLQVRPDRSSDGGPACDSFRQRENRSLAGGLRHPRAN